MSRSELRKRLLNGCVGEIARIPQDRKPRFVQIEGVPFLVGIMRDKVGHSPRCIVMRSVPEEQGRELEEILVRMLREKDLQLFSYARDGYEPALVIDNDNIMLLNRRSVAEAYARAVAKKPLQNISDVFVADTGHGEIWFCPLRLAARDYPDLPEFERYVDMQVVDRVRRRQGDVV